MCTNKTIIKYHTNIVISCKNIKSILVVFQHFEKTNQKKSIFINRLKTEVSTRVNVKKYTAITMAIETV